MNGALSSPDMKSPAHDDAYLIYDGECPFCSAYVKFMRLKQSVGPMRLIDAREGGPEVELVRKQGMDLNEGMVFHYGSRFYHGADALNILAVLSSGNSLFNKINGRLFRSPAFSRVAYPFLRAGRNTALKLLGRKQLPS